MKDAILAISWIALEGAGYLLLCFVALFFLILIVKEGPEEVEEKA